MWNLPALGELMLMAKYKTEINELITSMFGNQNIFTNDWYAIGVAHPTSIMVDTFGTGKLHDDKLVEIIRENFDLRPAGIIKMLDLRRPIYKQTASYGHFGRTDVDLPWEKLDKVDLLKKYL